MKHILVIEDEALIRDEIVILLEKAGYQVDKLTDFKDTSQQVLQYDTDLIILDLNLPGETGFQICKISSQNALSLYWFSLPVNN